MFFAAEIAQKHDLRRYRKWTKLKFLISLKTNYFKIIQIQTLNVILAVYTSDKNTG